MIDKIKLKFMKNKPTLDDMVSPNMSENARIIFRVSLSEAKREQDKIIKKAAMMRRN